MNTFMVTLCNTEGKDQRIVVQAPATDTVEDISAYVLNPATRGTKGETVMADSRVIGIRQLHIKRPVRTVMPEMHKTAV